MRAVASLACLTRLGPVRCQHSLPLWDDLPGAALILGVGGSTARVRAAGVDWAAAGAPTAVAEVCAALAPQATA